MTSTLGYNDGDTVLMTIIDERYVLPGVSLDEEVTEMGIPIHTASSIGSLTTLAGPVIELVRAEVQRKRRRLKLDTRRFKVEETQHTLDWA